MGRVLILLAAAAFGGLILASAPVFAQPVPQFRQYDTGPLFRGPQAAPDLRSREARAYRTRLLEAAPQPPNFASDHRLVLWGCGTSCTAGAVIDQRSGQVTFFPFSICCSAKDREPGFNSVEFRPTSALIIFTGLRNEEGVDGSHFYEFGSAGFRFLRTVPVAVPPQSQAGSVATDPAEAPMKTSDEPGAFPISDVEGKCRQLMKVDSAVGECIRREQPAYDLSRSLWNDLSAEQRKRARGWETLYGKPAIETNPAYYQNLLQAIIIENERAKQAGPPPKFRY